jgi:hypothetical protein
MRQSRAQRLGELRDEIARATGHADFADMSGPDRQRAEQAALLKLQYEVCAAKLVSGGELVTNELIALNEAIANTLPAAAAKPIEVVFVDGDPSKGGRTEEMSLREHIRELEHQLREARQHTTAPGTPEQAPASTSVPPAALPHNNVVPLRNGADIASVISAPHLDARKSDWPIW